MNRFILCLIEFVLAFTLVYLYHKLFVVKKYEKDKKKGKVKSGGRNKIPSEILLFLGLTKLDIKDVDDIKLLNTLAIVNSIDVGVVLLLTELTDIVVLKFLIAIVAVLVIIVCSYKLVAKFYIKKR